MVGGTVVGGAVVGGEVVGAVVGGGVGVGHLQYHLHSKHPEVIKIKNITPISKIFLAIDAKEMPMRSGLVRGLWG